MDSEIQNECGVFQRYGRRIESVLPITVQAETIFRDGNKSFPAAENYSEIFLFRVIAKRKILFTMISPDGARIAGKDTPPD